GSGRNSGRSGACDCRPCRADSRHREAGRRGAVTYRGTSVPGGYVRGPDRRTARPCAGSARMAVTLPARANRANIVPNRRGVPALMVEKQAIEAELERLKPVTPKFQFDPVVASLRMNLQAIQTQLNANRNAGLRDDPFQRIGHALFAL